jgi:hypothetical protein
LQNDLWEDQNYDGKEHQEGLLVVAEYKRMEKTSRGIGIPGGELFKRPEPDAGCLGTDIGPKQFYFITLV